MEDQETTNQTKQKEQEAMAEQDNSVGDTYGCGINDKPSKKESLLFMKSVDNKCGSGEKDKIILPQKKENFWEYEAWITTVLLPFPCLYTFKASKKVKRFLQVFLRIYWVAMSIVGIVLFFKLRSWY